MQWQLIAEKTFTPDVLEENIGSFSLEEDHDVVWFRITQKNGDYPNPWSYGILSWKSSEGHELGSIKVYGNTSSEVFRLGVGRVPSDRHGVVTFIPRGFNLAWIKEGNPWTLTFEAVSGEGGLGQDPALGTKATLMVPAVPRGNAQPDFSIEGELARLILNLFIKR